ncbi:MAG: poly-gamma-glutamate system protein, partial [Myxococcota bacterium]
DPSGSGLIGPAHTPIVSNEGHLTAKQTSANPNFSAAFVDMLIKAGVRRGDLVAANMTGSFPAMNIAMCAAFEVLGITPVIVSSVAASEYGATHPELTWLDMERSLFERELFSFRSRAVTLGGVLDMARDHSEEGVDLLRAAIDRSGIAPMYPASFEEAVRMRLDLFDQVRGDRDYAAYINIGGGTASVGTASDKRHFSAGVNTRVPIELERSSVMRHYLERNIPVIHISHIAEIARYYGLPETPVETPSPGSGGVFTQTVLPAWTIVTVLGLIFLSMYLATRFDLRTTFGRSEERSGPPEPMI